MRLRSVAGSDMRGSVTVDSERLARSQMDLNVGRLSPGDALGVAGVAVGALAVAALGVLVVVLVWSDYDMSWWRLVIASIGLLVLAGGVLIAATVVRLAIGSWRAYERRLEEWHAAALEAYSARQGVERQTVYATWDLSPDRARDVLLVALWCHHQRAQGVETPWAVRALTAGPLLLYGRRIGSLSEPAARDIANALSELGVVRGRTTRRAGEWAAQSSDELVRVVLEGYARLGRADE